MARSSDRKAAPTRLLLLGDNDTVDHRADLAEAAGHGGWVITGAYGFEPGEARATDDLTEVNAVVAALSRAIAERVDIWVPFLGADLGREQHWRRLSLVLQRHGVNLRSGKTLSPLPNTGGVNEIDFALRAEVRAVDNLDNAALAAAGVEKLSREIERALVDAGTRPAGAATARRGSGGADGRPWGEAAAGAVDAPGSADVVPPILPPPTVPWKYRKALLTRYARWLVHGCGVTRAATARILNSTGQRTATGKPWQPGTVGALLTGV